MKLPKLNKNKIPGPGFVIFFFFLLFTFLMFVFTRFEIGRGGPSYKIHQDFRRFYTIEAINELEETTYGNFEFVELEARYVRSDGTLNFKDKYPSDLNIYYVVELETLDDTPVGVDSNEETHKEYWVYFTPDFIFSYFMNVTSRVRRFTSPPPKKYSTIPKCSFESLWKIAINKGADPDAYATINYGDDINEYDFLIEDDDYYFNARFNSDCTLKWHNDGS